MMKNKFCLVAALLCAGAASAFAESVIADGAHLELLSKGFSFTEGPTCDSKGNVYFTDQNLDRILKWSTDGILTVFMSPAGRANGMYMDAEDHLIACADNKNELWRISLNGEKECVLSSLDLLDKYFNGPNDIWVHPSGDYYFTDPLYKRPWWGDRTGKELDSEDVYVFTKEKQLIKIANDLKKPNGIIGTPDGKTLFISDIGAGIIYKYAISSDKDGIKLENKQVFCKDQSDGLTLDDHANLYLTNGRGVVVYDKTGKEIEVIKVPEGWTANVCFGGKNHDVLFITASKGLYSIHLKYKGANPNK